MKFFLVTLLRVFSLSSPYGLKKVGELSALSPGKFFTQSYIYFTLSCDQPVRLLLAEGFENCSTKI
jgi:hypothetical protein